jgi:hypothetical protein
MTRRVTYSDAVKRGTIEDAAAGGTFRRLDGAVAEFIKAGATLDEIAGNALKVFDGRGQGKRQQAVACLDATHRDKIAARDAGDMALRAVLEQTLKK